MNNYLLSNTVPVYDLFLGSFLSHFLMALLGLLSYVAYTKYKEYKKQQQLQYWKNVYHQVVTIGNVFLTVVSHIRHDDHDARHINQQYQLNDQQTTLRNFSTVLDSVREALEKTTKKVVQNQVSSEQNNTNNAA